MKRKLLLLASFCVALAKGSLVYAQTDSVATNEGFSITGYVDSYYFTNFNNPQSRFNGGRIFDLKSNSFSLGLVQTMFTYTYGKSKVVADLTYGPNADLGNFGNFRHTLSSSLTSSSFAIKQAYVSYNLTNKLALTVGQYGTHIGYELIDAPLNVNYSLSYLFGNGPFYHTGAKLDYAASDKLSLMLGVVNGWDMLQDLNSKKSVTAQVHLAPTSNFHVYANYIGGDEHDGDSKFGTIKGSKTHLWDLTSYLQATDKFKIGLNAAYGSYKTGATAIDDSDPFTQDQTWSGAALYLNYAATDKFGIGVRAEHFDDPSGVRYFGVFKGNEFTFTGDIKLADGHFNLKPELRIDTAKDAFFEDTNGGFNKNSQVTFGAAVVYSFGYKGK